MTRLPAVGNVLSLVKLKCNETFVGLFHYLEIIN